MRSRNWIRTIAFLVLWRSSRSWIWIRKPSMDTRWDICLRRSSADSLKMQRPAITIHLVKWSVCWPAFFWQRERRISSEKVRKSLYWTWPAVLVGCSPPHTISSSVWTRMQQCVYLGRKTTQSPILSALLICWSRISQPIISVSRIQWRQIVLRTSLCDLWLQILPLVSHGAVRMQVTV